MISSSRICFLQKTPLSLLKIAIGVKQVTDHAIKVRVKDNKVQTEATKKSTNPFDEIALEEAVKLKEKGIATELIAITVGPSKTVEVLRNALAMGCDKAVHVKTEERGTPLDSLTVAKILCSLNQEIKADIWMMGKQAIDGDCGCTPQLLAGMLGIPIASFASSLTIDGKTLNVQREVDSGTQVVKLNIPCVVSADLRLNTPRFLKLPSIMKARKKPIDTREVSSFSLDRNNALLIGDVSEPISAKKLIRLKTADELLEKLRTDKVIR